MQLVVPQLFTMRMSAIVQSKVMYLLHSAIQNHENGHVDAHDHPIN